MRSEMVEAWRAVFPGAGEPEFHDGDPWRRLDDLASIHVIVERRWGDIVAWKAGIHVTYNGRCYRQFAGVVDIGKLRDALAEKIGKRLAGPYKDDRIAPYIPRVLKLMERR